MVQVYYYVFCFYQVALHLKLVCIMAKLHIISVQTLTTGNVCGMMIKIKIGDTLWYKYMMMRI